MVDSSDIPPPALTHLEEQKVETILELVGVELSRVPYEQQTNILYHVIEDLFMQREACLAKDNRPPDEAKQENTRLRHRLTELLRRFETVERKAKGGVLVEMKSDDEGKPPPSRRR